MTAQKRILVYDTKPYDRLFLDSAVREFGYIVKYHDEHLNADTVSFAKGQDVVCVFVNDTVNKAVIEELTRAGVGLVALRCAGYNNVDLKAAYGNLHVVRVPGYSPYAVAEHAAALLFSLNRKTHRAYYRTRDGNFSINGLMGVDLHEKTAGIIGTGKIGRCLIAILRGVGMRVLAYDAHPDPEYAAGAGVEYIDLAGLYAQSDVISLHCPLTKKTRHLIDKDSIARMKPGVILINTGRGALVDAAALIQGLKNNRIGAAGLDVYEEEGDYFFEDFSGEVIDDDILARLLTFPNVLITSHQAFFTREALTNIAQTTMRNIHEFFSGGYLQNEICYRCSQTCRKKQRQRCF